MQYLIPVIAFLGLIAGIVLKKTCEEEIKPGKPYFLLLQKVVIVTLIIALLYTTLSNTLLYFILILIGIITAIFFTHTYFYLGLALLTLNPLIATLTFIYGLPTGTLKPKVILNLLLFAIPFLLLIFNIIYTAPIALGALTTIFIKKTFFTK